MALTPRQDHMNRALDDQLSEAERAQWEARLAHDPRDAFAYEELQRIDAMLRQPPMMHAPVHFAASVMGAIQAGKHEKYVRPSRSFLWLGVLMGVIVAAPLIILGLVALGQALQNPDLLATTVHSLGQTLNTLSNFSSGVLGFLGELFNAHPVIPALLLTLIPTIVLLWGWLVWFLQQRNRPPTITVQVQVRSVS